MLRKCFSEANKQLKIPIFFACGGLKQVFSKIMLPVDLGTNRRSKLKGLPSNMVNHAQNLTDERAENLRLMQIQIRDQNLRIYLQIWSTMHKIQQKRAENLRFCGNHVPKAQNLRFMYYIKVCETLCGLKCISYNFRVVYALYTACKFSKIVYCELTHE